MSDQDTEERLSRDYRIARLPAAPTRLRALVDVPPNRVAGSNRPRPRLALAGLIVGTVVVGMLAVGSNFLSRDRWTGAVGAAPSSAADATIYTVSELLAARAAGRLGSAPVRLTGYWSDASVPHSCAPPRVDVASESPMIPGELEINCHDGEFGITERDERIAEFIETELPGHEVPQSRMVPAAGPFLTPWVPDGLWPQLQDVGRETPPVPIVVLGHLDDPRAENCRPEAVKLCRDRFVIDAVIELRTN